MNNIYQLLQNFIHRFFLKITGKEILLEGRCEMCGCCCRHINLRSRGRWIKSERVFRKILKTQPEYDRFEITGKNEAGSLNFRCTWLESNTVCKDHENRLDICKYFPEKEIYFGSAFLPENCGYRLKAHVPFKKIIKQKIKK